MWSLDKGGGAAGRNPATSPVVLAGEGAGKDLGVAHDRLVALVGVGTPLARGGTAARLVLAAATGGHRRGGSLGDQSVARGLQGVLEVG
jgi:hypothetical protein